jgi:amino acid transporter
MSAPPQGLPRRIGLWSAIAIVIGTVIGSGIFRSPAGIAAKLPGPLPMMSVWVMGGIVAMCGALSLAEIASVYPHTGGVYVYVREGWGRLTAFLFGWSELIIIRAAALGAIATTFAEYLLRVLGKDPAIPANGDLAHYVAAGAIIFTSAVNILGVRWGSWILNITGIAKYGGLLFLIILAFALGLPSTGGHYTPAAPAGSFSIAPFGLALVSVLWAYDGWADLSFIGGEVKDPERNLPLALIWGAVAVLVIYLLANMAYMAVLSVEEISQSKLVAADVAERLLGPVGVIFVAVTVMLSTFGTLTGSVLTSPRIWFAMADDGLFFKKVASVHPKYETPYVAILVATTLGVAFVLLRTFEQLADTFVTAIIPFYALAVAALFPLRRRAGYNPTFRAPFFPVVPVIFVLSTIFLLGNALIDPSSRWGTIGVLAAILAGIPVYYVTVGRAKAES